MNDAMREALELIAAPQRPDGTWNRDREACQRLAAEALKAQRKPLACKEINRIWHNVWHDETKKKHYTFNKMLRAFVRAIEAAHGIKGDIK